MKDIEARRDWVEWHRGYDDPESRLSRRLRAVQRRLRDAIDVRSDPIRMVGICSGEGRDVIPVLAKHPRRAEITARLVELDPRNAEVAVRAIAEAKLDRVEMTVGDAALTVIYAGAVPAEIVMACGVFGNISDDDIRNTIEHLPTLCTHGGTVIWTRGWRPEHDLTPTIRSWFEQCGFEEVGFDAPAGETFSVGVHRLAVEPAEFRPGVRLFTFLR